MCIYCNVFIYSYVLLCGPGSVVGIATGYGLYGPRIVSRCRGEIFRTCPDRSWGPPNLCTMGTASSPGLKSGRDVTLTPHPLLVPWSWKGRAIPLLPLWAVRPVQSLSACTRVHFIFFLLEITRPAKRSSASQGGTAPCSSCI